jgi:hypothetical protein
VYLPLVVVSYHEFQRLLQLTQGSAVFVRFDRPDDAQTERLKELRNGLLNFRLYYRFSHVSLITMHNRVHESWRRVFGLESMLQEVTRDVVEAERFLTEELEREKDRRFRIFGLAGSFALALLVASPLFKEVLDLLEPLFPLSKWARDALAMGLALLAAAVATGIVAWQSRGRRNAHGGHALHMVHLRDLHDRGA